VKPPAYLALLSAKSVQAFASINGGADREARRVGRVPKQSTEAVHIRNHAFDPAQLDVAAESTVTCITEDSVPRTISDSGQLLGESYSVEFGGTGTLRCHRAVDPEMNGSVGVGGIPRHNPLARRKLLTTPRPQRNPPAAPSGRPTTPRRYPVGQRNPAMSPHRDRQPLQTAYPHRYGGPSIKRSLRAR
jgi:plastocyanin